jgi:hypothetical protein
VRCEREIGLRGKRGVQGRASDGAAIKLAVIQSCMMQRDKRVPQPNIHTTCEGDTSPAIVPDCLVAASSAMSRCSTRTEVLLNEWAQESTRARPFIVDASHVESAIIRPRSSQSAWLSSRPDKLQPRLALLLLQAFHSSSLGRAGEAASSAPQAVPCIIGSSHQTA